MRIVRTNDLIAFIYKMGFSYPAPVNLNYWWNFGSYALLCLIIQIVSGILLAMHYVPDINIAFFSIEHLVREISYGWLLRYTHANGASLFFLAVYIHTFRGLYYSSYTHPRQMLWIVGVMILICMIITAFLGYVLPWGQMSFWGATVITNLLTAIPYVGKDIVTWLWGGFVINNATLQRFYSFHYILPFVIVGLVGLHLQILHKVGSNNPLGISIKVDDENFNPYYTIKDLFGMIIFIAFTCLFIFFAPNTLGHSDNYLFANPLVTPPHIVPEWYFLPFYAILRSIPDKVGGVSIMFISILTLFFVPYLFKPEIRSLTFRPISRYLYWIFVLDCLILGWVGGKPVASPFFEIGQFSTAIYIIYFWAAYPLVIYIEKWFWTNKSYMDSIIDKYLHYELWFAYWRREKQRPITRRKLEELYNYRKIKRRQAEIDKLMPGPYKNKKNI